MARFEPEDKSAEPPIEEKAASRRFGRVREALRLIRRAYTSGDDPSDPFGAKALSDSLEGPGRSTIDARRAAEEAQRQLDQESIRAIAQHATQTGVLLVLTPGSPGAAASTDKIERSAEIFDRLGRTIAAEAQRRGAATVSLAVHFSRAHEEDRQRTGDEHHGPDLAAAVTLASLLESHGLRIVGAPQSYGWGNLYHPEGIKPETVATGIEVGNNLATQQGHADPLHVALVSRRGPDSRLVRQEVQQEIQEAPLGAVFRVDGIDPQAGNLQATHINQ